MGQLGGWAVAGALAVVTAAAACQPERAAAPLPSEDPVARVRQELAARYAENEAGFIARDPDRVMRLRHPGFHTITPDGKVSTREQMEQRTRDFIGRIERFDALSETILSLTLEGDTAHAIVDQRTVRQQRFPDGTLHEVRTSVVQRESWVRTGEGWLLWRVDEIQPGETLVDGKPPPWPGEGGGGSRAPLPPVSDRPPHDHEQVLILGEFMPQFLDQPDGPRQRVLIADGPLRQQVAESLARHAAPASVHIDAPGLAGATHSMSSGGS